MGGITGHLGQVYAKCPSDLEHNTTHLPANNLDCCGSYNITLCIIISQRRGTWLVTFTTGSVLLHQTTVPAGDNKMYNLWNSNNTGLHWRYFGGSFSYSQNSQGSNREANLNLFIIGSSEKFQVSLCTVRQNRYGCWTPDWVDCVWMWESNIMIKQNIMKRNSVFQFTDISFTTVCK